MLIFYMKYIPILWIHLVLIFSPPALRDCCSGEKWETNMRTTPSRGFPGNWSFQFILWITWLIMHWYRDWACTDHVPGAGEAFHSGQRSWGRRLGIRKCGIEPQESTRLFSSICPPKKPDSPYCIALCSHLWFHWRLSPTTISLSLSKS